MQRLKDKVAVVTGAAMGLGHAIATRMAEEGAAVAVLDHLENDARAVAATLVSRGLTCESWGCDVSIEASVQAAIEGAASRFGRLDILVNNAGVSGVDKPTHEITEAEWDWVQAINVKGVFFGVKHAVPHMRLAGGGSIINLSSIYGLVGGADVPPYHASKGAVRLMTKTDALIYAADRIRVNSIHPGFIHTPMVEQHMARQANPPAAQKAAAALHPLGHMGEPDDVAWGAVYLASDEAKFVTGSELVIDGGYTAR